MSNEYSKSDQSFLRSYNIKKVRSILREEGYCSRVDLSAKANLDKKTITNIINEMLADGEVIVVSKSTNGVGRPKENLALNGKYLYSIGLDVGGTHVSGVIMDYTGKVLCDHSIDIASMSSDILMQLCNYIIEELLEKSKFSIEQIDKIGLAFPGYIDSKTGEAKLNENIKGWRNLPLADLFHKKYNVEIMVDDCSRLMALAELRYGSGREVNDFIVFDLGLGIGCGIVINGKVFYGSMGMSGEVGHTIVKVDGPRCTCGRNGCIESIASGWALTKQATELLDRGESPLLSEATNKNTIIPTVKEIGLAAKLGDDKCLRLLKNAGRYIAIGIVNSISIINPSKVIVGGRLILDNDIMFHEIVETVKREALNEMIKDLRIQASQLGDLATAIGAATLCMENYFEINDDFD
ncbi:MAG: ROK family protein [Clostridiales bacterium]|nr:ROK family protein [Clostridiales bacterium]